MCYPEGFTYRMGVVIAYSAVKDSTTTILLAERADYAAFFLL